MNPCPCIFDLLFEYDCVIIPGLGGFIGNYAPARVLAGYHTFLPPNKTLLFNVNLKQNDGLLAFRISREENISYGEALHSLELKVSEWQKDLNSGRTIEIDKVGKLYKDREGNIQFDQDGKINFLAESYGLTSFISPAVSRKEINRKPVRQISRYKSAEVHDRPVLSKALKWAAILALPVGTAAVLGISNFEKIRSLSVAYSGMLVSNNAPGPSKVSLPAKAILPVKTTKKDEVKPAHPMNAPTRTESKDIQPDQPKPYSIIVGAFKFLENAKGLIVNLREKGYSASMAGQTKTGLYRVSLSSFTSKEEAIRQLELVRSNEFSSAWLLVKQ